MAKTTPLTNTEVKQAKPKEKVYKLGADGFITKPLEKEKLLVILTKLLKDQIFKDISKIKTLKIKKLIK